MKNQRTGEAFSATDVEKKYSCKACGSSFSAEAPDDVHRFSSVYQCWTFDWIERQYKCPHCGVTTILYWHSKVHKYPDYATARQLVDWAKDKKADDTLAWTRRMADY